MKESTFKYVIKDTFNHNKILATIKPHGLLITKQRFSILDARGYSTTENERYRVDRYINNEYIYTSLLLTEEEEEEPTLEEPDYDNLDDLDDNDAWDNVKYREDNDDYDNLDNLPNYDNLHCLELLND